MFTKYRGIIFMVAIMALFALVACTPETQIVEVDRIVEKEVQVEVPVDRIVEVEKQVEVPVDRIVEVEKEVPVEVTVEKKEVVEVRKSRVVREGSRKDRRSRSNGSRRAKADDYFR